MTVDTKETYKNPHLLNTHNVEVSRRATGMNKKSTSDIPAPLDCLVMQRYKVALEKIAKLEDAKEMRNPLASSCPSHLMTKDGFEPIHPMLKEGLRVAAKIAKEALDE